MNQVLTVGSLFSGVGGFDLGLERAGMRVVWQAESDAYCRRVLARHWPGVPCHPDVRALVANTGSTRLEGRWIQGAVGDGDQSVSVPVPRVDVLAGGFPCQDLSYAGRGAGLDGVRSALWYEFARLIGELRPRYALAENVPGILARGLVRVIADLAALGYDAEWESIPASAFGAPHQRDRVWIVAYPSGDGVRDESGRWDGQGWSGAGVVEHDGTEESMADAARLPEGGPGPQSGAERQRTRSSDQSGGACVADADEQRWDGRSGQQRQGRGRELTDGGWWELEPDVGRVAHGIPHRVDRLRCLGNALVPQIAEWIGRSVMEHETGQR